ncbi:hypothetical protein FACS1894208_00440 [Clostridia bacterium]|nr:hypothetical protein FACS1894208_00440 [Clostridia bacterium]
MSELNFNRERLHALLQSLAVEFQNSKPPEWVRDAKYTCVELTAHPGWRELYSGGAVEEWENELKQESLPVFLRHNLLVTERDILSAY